MTITDLQSQVAGHECIELSIPRGSDRWKGTLYVDPTRDCLPIRFTMALNGVVTVERHYSIRQEFCRRLGGRLLG